MPFKVTPTNEAGYKLREHYCGMRRKRHPTIPGSVHICHWLKIFTKLGGVWGESPRRCLYKDSLFLRDISRVLKQQMNHDLLMAKLHAIFEFIIISTPLSSLSRTMYLLTVSLQREFFKNRKQVNK